MSDGGGGGGDIDSDAAWLLVLDRPPPPPLPQRCAPSFAWTLLVLHMCLCSVSPHTFPGSRVFLSPSPLRLPRPHSTPLSLSLSLGMRNVCAPRARCISPTLLLPLLSIFPHALSNTSARVVYLYPSASWGRGGALTRCPRPPSTSRAMHGLAHPTPRLARASSPPGVRCSSRRVSLV